MQSDPSQTSAAESPFPGVSAATLQAANIHPVDAEKAQELAGTAEQGYWIPYPGTEDHGRLAIHDPDSGTIRYHCRDNGQATPYIPPQLESMSAGETLILVSGEVSVLALTERGFAAVGLTAFAGFKSVEQDSQPGIHPALADLVQRRCIEKLYFLADGAAYLDPEFYRAVSQAAELFKPVDVYAATLSPPGDILAGWLAHMDSVAMTTSADRRLLNHILSSSLLVTPETPAGKLVAQLLHEHAKSLKEGNIKPLDRETAKKRIFGLGVLMEEVPGDKKDFEDIATKALKIRKGDYRDEVNKLLEEEKAQKASRLSDRIEAPYAAIVKKQGPMLTNIKMDRTGTFIQDAEPAEPFWAELFAHENDILFEPDEQEFYLYASEEGIWKAVTEAALKQMVSGRIHDEARKQPMLELLDGKRHNRYLTNIIKQLQGIVEKRGVFNRDSKKTLLPLVHCRNGALDLATTPPELKPFSKEHYVRNRLPLDYNPDADCRRFKNELLKNALSDDDIALLQRWFGMAVLQDNMSKKFLILEGRSDTGKSQIARIAELLVGEENCTELRTEYLHDKFELYSYYRKTLLLAPDVRGNFLMQRGTQRLKAIVGGDTMTAEGKSTNVRFNIRGRFNVLITTNERLRILMEDDYDAWKTRLLILTVQGEPPHKKITDFGEKLFEEEGSGILNWAVEGANNVLRELRETESGGISLADTQIERIDSLLEESNSLEVFVSTALMREKGAAVTVDQLKEAYAGFCRERNWQPVQPSKVTSQLQTFLSKHFTAAESRSIPLGDQNMRGYRGVVIKEGFTPSD